MMTVLPTAEAGTRHFTEVGESKIMFGERELESGSVMWHTLVELKFLRKLVTVTLTASKRANGGFNMTGMPDGTLGGGGAEGDSSDVSAGASPSPSPSPSSSACVSAGASAEVSAGASACVSAGASEEELAGASAEVSAGISACVSAGALEEELAGASARAALIEKFAALQLAKRNGFDSGSISWTEGHKN
jgi:hypothetical protein